MSEKMFPLSIRELLKRMTEDHRSTKGVFGVTSAFSADREKTLPIFGEKLEYLSALPPARIPRWRRTSSAPTLRERGSLS